MTRRTNLSSWWQHDHVDADSSADVIAAIESAAAAAINSIKAVGAAARSATEQPQLTVNDTVDHIINSSEVTDVASLHTDNGLSPASSVDAMNAIHAPLTISGLDGDGSGTVTSADATGKQAIDVPAGGTIELNSPYSGTISFDGATGSLKIDHSASFSGKIAGQLATGDVIDFADITAGASATLSYSGNNSPGTLTVSDGTHTASIALLGNYSLANFTASSDGHGGTSVIDPPLPGDGSANAPAGTPQLPNILSGYTERPSWMVAGVDYAVGIPQGTVLKDPASINMAGVTVDKTNHQIMVTAANITLDAYDFSLAGGWEVVTQAANTTISNSNFKIGANHNPLVTAAAGSSNLTVLNCVLDGNNTYDTLDNDLIGAFTPGLTVKYSLFENGYAHFISAAGGQLTLEYNVFNNTGNMAAHPDWLQTQTGDAHVPYTETIMYNTAFQTSVASRPPGSGGTQGFMLNDNGSVIANAEFAYNTMLDLADAQTSPLTSVDGSRVTGSVSVHDNFADTSGGNGYGTDSFFADPAYSPNALYYHNINMSTGGLYYQNATVEPTAPVAPKVNPLVGPVITTPADVPSTPVITSHTVNGNIVTLKGTATSNDNYPYSTVQIFDGSTQIGLADTDANGNWSFNTGALAAGTHSFTAKSNGFYGYVSPASAALSQTIGSTAGAGAVLTSITETPSSGQFNAGHVVALTLTMSSVVTVTGTPTLTLNDGGTATYAGGSGTTALTFSYTVGSGDANVSSLAANAVNLPGGATIKDPSGNSASLALTGLTQTGPQIDTTAPTVSSVVASGTGITAGAGDLAAGSLVTLAVHLSEAVTVAGGTPTLSLNEGGTATYTGGSGSNALTFSYTVAAGHNTPDLAVTAVNLNGATVKDGAGNAASLSGALTSPAGTLQIDTTTPNAPVETGASIVNGSQVQITGTAEANSTVHVFDGTTQMGTATANGSGAWSLTTATLASGSHSFTSTATDLAGNTGLASAALAVTIVSSPTAPAAPTIVSYTNDSGVAGDGITNDNTLTLSGTAAANSTVEVFDGTTQIATATADSSGAWSSTATALADGSHNLTATATNASGTSSASAARAVTIDTVAPNAPVETGASIVSGTTKVQLTGTAEANSAVQVFDGTTPVGTATANSSGTWSLTTGTLASGGHSFTAKATDVAGNTGLASAALAVTIPSAPTAPAAPTIASFSNDSGVPGDGITNDNTLTLAGTAAANSTVKVFDGTTPIGTATAKSDGSWSYVTAVLNDAKHMLTAKAIDASGQTSDASSVFAVTIDTSAPGAPTIAATASSSSQTANAASASTTSANVINLTGTAEANSTVDIFDGAKQIGTSAADAKGTWSYTTGTLVSGNHSFTAKAVDAAGNMGTASAALAVNIPSTTPTSPAAPTIASFSNDSGVAGDHITNDSTLTLHGSAVANSTVNVFDGASQIGTATANSSGAWSYTTAVLKEGAHSLTAMDMDIYGQTSAASSALAVTIDTHAPNAPTIAVYSPDGKAVGGTTTADDLILKGTAEANSTVSIFDGGKQIGTATAGGNGLWSLDTGHLADGNHSFTSTASDVAGNPSMASAVKGVTVDAPASAVEITNMYENSSHIVTIKGTADAYSQIKIYDGTKSVGLVDTGADGTWSYTTASAVSNTVHKFSAQEIDKTGQIVTSSGSAILGTTGNDTLTSTAGDDLFKGHGGHDTFVFAPNFGHDVIKDFAASGRSHDVVQFSKSVFDDFADVLAHATQSGHDVVIAAGASDSLTLKNVKLAALDKTDFHFS